MISSRALAGHTDGGRFADRRPFGLRLLWLAPAAFAAQLMAIHFLSGVELRVALPIAHLLVLPFLIANFRFLGIRLMTIGLLLNLLVIVVNGGLMPVEPSAVEAVGKHDGVELRTGEHIPGSKNVLLDGDDIHLRELSDVILLPFPQPYKRAISVGDIFIVAGIAAVGLALASQFSVGRRPDE